MDETQPNFSDDVQRKWMKLPQGVVMDDCCGFTATIWIGKAPSKSTPMIMIAMSTTLQI